MEVYGFLDYESLAVLVHASRSVQHAYEPVALLLVKGVRAAAGRVGHLRVRLHRTSLVHNLWKLWRRSIPAFSRSAWCPCPWRVLGRTSQSTGSGLRVATGSHRPDVLLASPMVPFMDLLLTWGLDIWTSHRLRPVRFGRVQVSTWELTGAADGWQVRVEVRRLDCAESCPLINLSTCRGFALKKCRVPACWGMGLERYRFGICFGASGFFLRQYKGGAKEHRDAQKQRQLKILP